MTEPFKKILLGLKNIIENQSLAEGHLKIKDIASNELKVAIKGNKWSEINPFSSQLAKPFLDVMTKENAIPICADILNFPFAWVPPKTSDDPLYTAHSHSKVHVELLGPQGIIKSKFVRLGLYGILPNSEYGIRTHPAEELFIMLAVSFISTIKVDSPEDILSLAPTRVKILSITPISAASAGTKQPI